MRLCNTMGLENLEIIISRNADADAKIRDSVDFATRQLKIDYS